MNITLAIYALKTYIFLTCECNHRILGTRILFWIRMFRILYAWIWFQIQILPDPKIGSIFALFRTEDFGCSDNQYPFATLWITVMRWWSQWGDPTWTSPRTMMILFLWRYARFFCYLLLWLEMDSLCSQTSMTPYLDVTWTLGSWSCIQNHMHKWIRLPLKKKDKEKSYA